MQITFLGTGSAMPTGDRYQAGIFVQDEDDGLLIDCGCGILHRLEQTGIGYENVPTVLLTHHHLDHIADIMPLMKARWLAGAEHLEIVGPAGTKSLIDGLLEVHSYMKDRIDLAVREIAPGSQTVAGFEIETYETRHSMPCLAYRFDDRFAFSGDSEAFEGLANFLDETAVVAHDCSFPDGIDVSNHPTPETLGSALAGIDIGRLYLTHLYPQTVGHHREMVESVSSIAGLEVSIPEDGETIRVS